LHIGQFRHIRASIATARKVGVLALLSIVSVLPSAAAAQEPSVPSYDVELVIFLHLSSNATDEVWNLESAVGEPLAIPSDDASPFESTAPTSGAAPAQNFPALPASKLKLTAIEEALRRSRNYRPIAHIGWTQPGFARAGAPLLSLDAFVPASSGLTGQVAVSRGRYLHLTLDLSYTGSDSQRYVLRQSRRMRSNERHYIDHPKFGVIAVVTPSDRQ
jgi:hypothetical protein